MEGNGTEGPTKNKGTGRGEGTQKARRVTTDRDAGLVGGKRSGENNKEMDGQGERLERRKESMDL